MIGQGTVLFGGARLGERLPDVVADWPGGTDAESRTTPPEQWATLLRLPAAQSAASLNHPFAVCIEIHVHSGVVGVGAQRRSGARLEDEWWAYPNGHPVTVVLPVTAPSDFDGLWIRNASPESRPSQLSLRSLSAYALEMSGEGVFAAVQDSDAPTTEAAITTAFEQRGLEILRGKWSELPGYAGPRVTSAEMNAGSDDELGAFYDQAMAHILLDQSVAGKRLIKHWPYGLYLEAFRGKRVLDVGSGLGYDALFFAGHGADWTCLDIVESNLANIRRIAAVRGVSVKTHYLESFASIDELGEFDVIWCHGSMINAPFSYSAAESRKLLEHLPVGGRWIELCYPKVRWEREGHLPLHRWGERTDGFGTPWMEWYDTEKLLKRLEPGHFVTYLAMDVHNSDFNWFDFLRIG